MQTDMRGESGKVFEFECVEKLASPRRVISARPLRNQIDLASLHLVLVGNQFRHDIRRQATLAQYPVEPTQRTRLVEVNHR